LVDYLHNKDDYECALLGALGFSSNYIQGKTGLRTGQISYRLRKAHIRRMEFRNGQSIYAKMVLRNMRSVAEPKLLKELYQLTPPLTKDRSALSDFSIFHDKAGANVTPANTVKSVFHRSSDTDFLGGSVNIL
jgi:hypothetical protein